MIKKTKHLSIRKDWFVIFEDSLHIFWINLLFLCWLFWHSWNQVLFLHYFWFYQWLLLGQLLFNIINQREFFFQFNFYFVLFWLVLEFILHILECLYFIKNLLMKWYKISVPKILNNITVKYRNLKSLMIGKIVNKNGRNIGWQINLSLD